MSTKGRTLLMLPFVAGALVERQRFAAAGANPGAVIHAAGATDAVIGVTDRPSKAGDVVDVVAAGAPAVEYGGAIAYGDRVVSGADGKAHAAPAKDVFQALVAGAAANTDIAVAGILATDVLVGAVELEGAAYTDLLATTSIHADGAIRVTSATNGNKVLVTWRRPTRTAGIALRAGVAGDIGQVLLAPAGL